ncbi:MAG: autotransporter-associated beta strand repeat-containing protein, partial [Thermoguttaceae bacterium]
MKSANWILRTLTTALVVCAVGTANAATQYWSLDAGSTYRWGTTSSTITDHWTDTAGTSGSMTWVDGSDVVFNNFIPTIVTGDTITMGNLTVGTGSGMKLTGGTNTIVVLRGDSTSTVTFNNAGAVIVSNLHLAGEANLLKTGAGKLTLNSANTFTGVTTIQQGALTLQNVDALQYSTLNYVGGGLTYVATVPTTFNVGGITGVKTLALTQGAVAVSMNVGNNNLDTAYTGNINGLGALTKSGTGMLTLTGSNTYAGGTTVASGTLRVAKLDSLSGYNVAGSVSVASGAVLMATDATLYENLRTSSVSFASGSYLGVGNRFNTSESMSVDTLSSTMGFAKGDLGTLTITGTSSYGAGTRIDGGNLVFATPSAVPTSGLIAINSKGALNVTGAYTTVAGWLGSGKISTSSTGVLALTGNSSENVSMSSYTDLSLGAAVDSTYSGTLTPASSAYHLGGGGATLTVTSNLADSGGATNLTIGGNVVLAGTNTITGSTTVNAGVLTARTTSALAGYDTAGKISVAKNAAITVSLGGSTGWTEAQLDTLKANATFASGAGWGIDTTNGNYTYSSDITGTTSFAKSGANTLTLSGATSYTGATIVTAGELQVNSGTLSGVISGSGNLTKIGSGALTISGANKLTGAVTLNGGTVSLTGVGSTDGGAFSYASGVTVNNGATLSVEATNALGGYELVSTDVGIVPAVTINAGGVMTISNTLACYAPTVNLNGGVLASAGSTYTYGSWTLRNAVNVTGSTPSTISATSVMLYSAATNGVTFNVASGSTLNVTGTIVSDTVRGLGYGALVKTGAGTMLMTGANTYIGSTIVKAGTLKMNSAAYAMPLTVMAG